MNNVILTLPEFAEFMKQNLGMTKELAFYRHLVNTGQLTTSFKGDNNKWYVKVDDWIYKAKDMKEILEENIRLKEKLENIKKMID